MAQEIELKLAVPDDALAQLAAWLDANGEAKGEVTLLNVYLDTPERDLARARAALRLRRKGAQWLQTLKTAGQSLAGLASRNEWETEVAGEAIELQQLPDEARALLTPLADRLAPVFRTDFARRTWILEHDARASRPRSTAAPSPHRPRTRRSASRNWSWNGCPAIKAAPPIRCMRSAHACRLSPP